VKAPDNTPPRARRKHATALTTRLITGYVLVSLITSSAAAAFLYHRLQRSFEIEDTEYLNAHINSLRAELAKNPTNLPTARDLIVNSHTYRKMDALFGQISTRDGRVVLEAPGFTEVVLDANAFPPPVREDQEISEVKYYRKSPFSPQMLLASAMVRREQTKGLLVYRVALDVDHVDAWMREYRSQLIWVVLAATTLSGALAWLLTRQALRPLRQINAAMKQVSASGLDGRLGHNPWPKELAETAGEFDLMLERLRDAFHRLSQFSADAAHEFRTPLNGLMISTSLMLSQDRENEAYRQVLATNLQQYERLRKMVDSLLFIARADNAEAVLKRENVDVTVLADEVLDYFSALAEERGITTQVQGSGTAHGDATLLRLAISNLVSNALQHTPRGGKVTIAIQESPGLCTIEVSDTGIGIAPDHLPRLFDRFYRVDAARTARSSQQQASGVGLGLALVQTIVQLHGGQVKASSTLGEGTTMRLSLPGAVVL
jgi:two-component system heavy metal sensor histidine kinase CusS